MFDTSTQWSLGGGGACIPWCSVGQVAQDGSTRAYAAVYDHQKGQPGQVGGPGVWMVQFQSVFGDFSPFAGVSPLAPGFGLGGDQPTAVALGPDGKLYVGFLKNGNIKRVTNPSVLNPTSQNQTVESVGSTPNGRPMRAMAFLGADLYLATDQGLAVVRNVGACIGNQGGCGNAVPVQDGFTGATHVGVATDGAGKVYFSVNGAGAVYRYTPADGRVVPVSLGFAFVGGHTNTLSIDGFGNLWIGDDPTDGLFNFSGRLWRVPAAALASIP
jgi:streptogramin lyase